MKIKILLAVSLTIAGIMTCQSVGEDATIVVREELGREIYTRINISENELSICEEEVGAVSNEPLPTYTPPEMDVNAIARTLYGECRGIPSSAEKAAVAWVILNRVDAGFGDTVLDVVTAPNQFLGYNEGYPILEELEYIAIDVLTRWNSEKSGETGVGRVIPSDYLWFHGDGKHNYFRNEFRSNSYWDWSLENPYED